LVAGAYVQSISENSPASKAGIKIGDIITEIDSEKLMDSDNGDLVKVINKKKIGDVIEVKIWRENKEKTVSIILEKKVN
jgi:serine protease Do